MDRLARSGLIPAGAGQTRDKHGQAGALGAHPRGCGADGTRPTTCTRQRGSSPRVRGRLRIEVVDGQATGLIPAGAGQTVRRPRLVRCPWAHPRGCGGRLVCSVFRLVLAGLIPAGAGQTLACSCSALVTSAHPRGCGADGALLGGRALLQGLSRGCGADFTATTVKPGNWGSSPRVRGRLGTPFSVGLLPGLIPAGAGQTGLRTCIPRRRRAHPRGCGADSCWRLPRVERDGLIPAGAGQTRS